MEIPANASASAAVRRYLCISLVLGIEVVHGDGLRTLHDAAQGETEGLPQIP